MRLKSLNATAKLAVALFALTVLLGTAYSLGLMALTTAGSATMPTLDQVRDKYTGSLLVSAMRTSMYDYVTVDESIDEVASWVQGGRDRQVFHDSVMPILQEDCTNCHSRGSTMTDAAPGMPLTSYEDVLPLAEAGLPWARLASQSHTHLFGIGLFVTLLALLMAHTDYRGWLKVILIGGAFLGLWGDVLSWLAGKYTEAAGLGIYLAGALLSASVVAMALLVILDLWLRLPLLGIPRESPP